MLAAAIWNNVLNPMNVNGDAQGLVSPNDVLRVINDLNHHQYGDPITGRLPVDIDTSDAPFLDVNCDGLVSPNDALQVINHLNRREPDGGLPPGAGAVYPSAACSPHLLESTQFASELTWELILPDDTSAAQVIFLTPEFDSSTPQAIRDAFEIEITDDAGNPITFPFSADVDAVYNWSEGLEPVLGAAVTTSMDAQSKESIATINLSGLPANTLVRVTARLVNNDLDEQTSVVIRGFDIVDAQQSAPAGAALATNRIVDSEPVHFGRLTDLTGSFQPGYGRTTLSGDNDRLTTELTITNVGNQAVNGQLVVVLENFSSLDAYALRPDGLTPAGDPYFDLTPGMDGAPFTPGDSLRSREIRFLNNAGDRFQYELKTFGAVNAAPSAFTSEPITSIEAGNTFRYLASATDPDSAQLSYSRVFGPELFQIDPATGAVSWITDEMDVGSHRITIRATDPHGLFVEQSFNLNVLASLQNRPPNFVSEPITEAIASSGFEITTVGTGNSPSGAAVIGGFRGPRLVSINAGDQSVSVHAGQNNDRFDDTTVYSTGEPRPTDSPFDIGYSVDVGLPSFQYPGDSNEVLGMDQGDLNGDGILDLVAATFIRVSSCCGNDDTVQITRMLGDGDGNFSPPLVIGSLEDPDQIKNLAVADVDGDGNLDVMALERRTSKVFSIFGNGDGNFLPMVTTTLDVSFDDFRIVDLDQDGHVDLVGRRGQVGFGVTYDLVWKPGIGDGAFLPVQEIAPNGSVPNAFRNLNARPYDIVDIDGDGDRDIVIANNVNGNVDVLLNDGNQQFAVGVSLDPPGGNSAPYVVHVADLTGDGDLDIAAANSWTPSQIDLFVGDGSGLTFVHRDGGKIFNHSGNWAGSDKPVDIDGDGDLDLVFGNGLTNSEGISPQVLTNDGAGFFVRTDYPMIDFTGQLSEANQTNGDIARSAMFGDYNSDGVMDLAYSTTGADFNGVGIRLGTRPGEFGGTRSVPFTENSGNTEAHPGDFNGDGILDLLALASAETLLGNGDGTFADPILGVSASRLGDDGAVADFNLDGLTDIVSNRARTNGSRYYVALSNGNGTFEVSDDKLVEASFYGYSSMRIADFNVDGYPDFIAKDGTDGYIDVHLNDPNDPGVFNRSFRATVSAQGVNVSGFLHAFTTGDFNEDGNMDFAVADQLAGEPMKLVLYAGDGQGDFTVASESFAYSDDLFSGYYYSGDLDSGDLNEDGHMDIVSFTYGGPLVHLGNGDGTFRTTDFYPFSALSPGGRARNSYVFDVDEDGHEDLIQVSGGSTLNIHRGLGDGTFREVSRIGILGGVANLAFADLDHDGHLDVVHAVTESGNHDAPQAAIYAGVRDGLVDVLSVDLNGDGNEEILAVNEANDRLKLFVGDNLGGLTRQPDLLTGRAPRAVEVADLNGDGVMELITANRAGRSLTVFSGAVKNGYVGVDFPLPNGAIDVAAADLDSNGIMDVVALDDTDQALWIFAGDGTSTLTVPVAVALGDAPGGLTLKDATGDGIIDAVVTLPDSHRIMILPGDGSTGFGSPVYVDLASSPGDVAVVDLNDDGNPDLAATLPNDGKLSVLYGRGGSQFAKAQQIVVGEKPTRVTLADADEDGRTDLIVTNAGDATTSVIYNRFDPNEVYRYDSDAIDPDDDPLMYAIVDGPGGLIINSDTGELLWAASPDQVGVHDVTISADDGHGGIATQSFKIDVQPARDNAPPLIATEPATTIGAAETFTYQATALDNDRDALRYRIVDAPAGATIDPTTGLVQWDGRTDQGMSFGARGLLGNIEVGPNVSLKPESITVEGWFNLHSLPRYNTLIEDAGRNGVAYRVETREYNQLIRVTLEFDSSSDRIQFEVPRSPELDRWYHLALTYDAPTGTATFYMDGQAVGTGTTPTPQPLAFASDTPTSAGRRSSSGTQAIIDNYRIWNIARSQTEIQEGMGRQYEDDARLVLDYRFDLPDTRTVRDFSPAKNTGFLRANGLEPQLAPGLANPGMHFFTVGVEDGRGGFDTQSFELHIVPELRGSLVGHLFDDLDGDGSQSDGSVTPAEPSLEGWQLFIDTNGNGYPDPSERQATTDAAGNYTFPDLLPGVYPMRVSPTAGYETPAPFDAEVTASEAANVDLAIEQLSLSQIRGQLKTEDEAAIAYWKVYADLDGDRSRGDDEPMAVTDRAGNYALTGLEAGIYSIHTDLPAGWADTAGRDGLTVTLAADEVVADNDFVLEPTNTSVTGGIHFVTMPGTTVQARQTFRYASIASSINDEPITYDLSLAPDGLTIDPHRGLVAWRPTISQVGEHLVVLRATSESGSISLHDFYLDVSAPNSAPVLSTDPGLEAYVGLTYSVDLQAQDAESHIISFCLLSGPADATLDVDTGIVRWTPTASDVGAAPFSVELSDALGASTVVNFAVEVIDSQPTATPFQIIMPRSVVGLGQEYFAQVTGTDVLARPLSWSLTSGPAGLNVSGSGNLQWTPGSEDLGEQIVELEASSVDGETEAVSFTPKVVGRPVNSAPGIVSTPVLSAVIGDQYEYPVAVTDNDSDPLAFALLDAPTGMSIHPSLGTILWTPALDQLGESDVSVQVTDPDGATATQVFTLKASRSGGPPVITSIPPTEAAVGSGYLYTLAARDAEGDPLTYRLLAAPKGMVIVETTGEIAWTPAPDQTGQQAVVVEVSDGIGGAATQAFAIRVSQGVPNLPPQVTSTAPRFGAVGRAYSYHVEAADPELTVVTYSLGQAPDGMTIDSTGGQVAWTPAVGQTGQFVVTIIATDEGGASAVESFELDVLPANNAPVISSDAPVDVAAGAVFTYQLLASDMDLDQLTYELTTAPTGADIDAFGKITWPTAVTLIGSHDFAVQVHDPRGGEAIQSFTLDVIEDTVPPKLSLIEDKGDASRNILPWQGPFKVYVRAIDNVAVASLTLSANGQDIPLDAAGTATFTFEDWKFTEINATAEAVDTNGNVTTKTITFDYDFPFGWSGAGTEDIPTAVITSPAEADAVTGMVSITGTATHEDFAAYKLSYRRVDESSFTEFLQSDTPVTNGELGVWDTSLLLNDEYVIRLEVATDSGVVNVVEHNVGLSGQLKLGQFELSFVDMTVPVAGLPIAFVRSYNTLRADRVGEFGHGWRLEYRDTDLRVSLEKSGLEEIGIYEPLREGVKVYLTLPGNERQGFTFTPDVRVLPGFGGNNLVVARPRFTPDQGVTSTLSAGTSSYLQVNELGQLFAPGGIPYNPSSPDFGGAYVVTTRDGTRYRIDGNSGLLESATDRNGIELTFANDGITSSLDEKIDIQRDREGRILHVTDDAGESVTYGYSSAGDLVSVTNRVGDTTQFEYISNPAHYLEKVIDPTGRTIIQYEYDANGRLLASIDANGNRTALDYDTDNSLQTFTDPAGRTTTVEFDNRGNVIREIDALGNATRKEYDQFDNEIAVTDPLGHRIESQFDSRGNLISTTDAQGQKTTHTYDNNNAITAIVDALGNVFTTEYDANGNVTKVQDAGGVTIEYTVNASGLPTSIYFADGATVESTYNAQGRQTHFINIEGLASQTEYDAAGNHTRSTWTIQGGTGGARAITTESSYDAAGRLVSQTDTFGQVTETEYDDRGNVSSRTDALGNRVTSSFDELGRPSVRTFADGTTIVNEMDVIGNVVAQTDEAGNTTRFVYDPLNRLVEVIFPDDTPSDPDDNPRVEREYDAAGRLTATINELGFRIEYEYDAAGREILRRDAIGSEFHFQYDALGRQTASIDANGAETRFEYDAQGRLTRTTFADRTTSLSTYDAEGNVISREDQNGRITQFEYDGFGRLVTVVDALAQRTQYAYDELGALVEQIDANSNSTRFESDDLGRRTAEILPLGQRAETTYDPVGRVATYTDFNGLVTTLTYDQRGRVIDKTFSDGTSSQFTYTSNGLLQSATNENGTTTYTYDSRNRLTSYRAPDGRSVSYQYDAAGNVTSLSSPAGTVTYAYDTVNRLISVTDGDGGETIYQYDAVGILLQTNLPNGVVETVDYDQLYRPIIVEQADANSTVLARYKYTLDATGRRLAVEELGGRVVEWSYDPLYRLMTERIADPIDGERRIDYVHDSVGNRLRREDSVDGATSYEYDANDRLRSSEHDNVQTIYEYDDNGNIKAESTSDRVRTYEWDAENRLIQVETTENSTVSVVENKYDASGLRLEQIVDGDATRYLHDVSVEFPRVIEEYTAGGVIKASYVYGNGRISQERDGERLHFGQDAHSGTRLLTDATGLVAASYAYDAFGREISGADTLLTAYLYRGEQRDTATGLDYLRARYLDPDLGRFDSRDPFEGFQNDPLTLNDYGYVSLDPINFTDPSGESKLTEALVSFGIANTLSVALTGGLILYRTGVSYKAGDLTWLEFGKIVASELAFAAAGYGVGKVAGALLGSIRVSPAVLEAGYNIARTLPGYRAALKLGLDAPKIAAAAQAAVEYAAKKSTAPSHVIVSLVERGGIPAVVESSAASTKIYFYKFAGQQVSSSAVVAAAREELAILSKGNITPIIRDAVASIKFANVPHFTGFTGGFVRFGTQLGIRKLDLNL